MRYRQPKVQPKSAATYKRGVSGVKAGANPKGVMKGISAAAVRRGRNYRATKKTAEQLDAELADFFRHANSNNNNSAGASAAVDGDVSMED
jgi:THO complex subunit 4